MPDDGFDRIPSPAAPGRRRRSDGRAVLFSDKPLPQAASAAASAPTRPAPAPSPEGTRQLAGLTLRCPRCEAATPVSPLALLFAAFPLPLPTLALTPGRADMLARCQRCGQRNWLRLSW